MPTNKCNDVIYYWVVSINSTQPLSDKEQVHTKNSIIVSFRKCVFHNLCFRWDEWAPEERLLKYNAENLAIKDQTHKNPKKTGKAAKTKEKPVDVTAEADNDSQ